MTRMMVISDELAKLAGLGNPDEWTWSPSTAVWKTPEQLEALYPSR